MSHVPAHSTHFTYADYVTWPPDERWEIIDGVAYAMTPAPSTAHQRLLIEFGTQLHTQLRGKKCEAFIAPFDVRLPEQGETPNHASTVVQPDLSVVCDPKKIDKRGCIGPPDFIIEIVSPGNAVMDQVRKLALYERHGVREYWILHPTEKVVTMLVRNESGKYGDAKFLEATGTHQISVLEGVAIDFDLAFPTPQDVGGEAQAAD
jgi:Uma2 family endonuclease